MKRSHILLFVFGSMLIALTFFFIGKALGTTSISSPFDPKHTTCFIFDMSKAGWTLVTEKNRYWVSEQVSLGKVEWMEAETTTCYRRYPDKSLGEKIILRNEWYQKRRLR